MAMHPTHAQIRGARAMLGWSITDLAEAAGVSVSTVKRMEMMEVQPLSSDIRRMVCAAFTAAGVEFIVEAHGVGVMLATP